ncbi:MAG: ABC transporter permease [Melioribacteraceae bacterium]|nr:ABC transporter permease [Melioribacteraceae bacterium]MCF8356225.1 ABC transporter permease [Melioribacteraceae bacterium]MCF8395632.1 ABC transporter permease [Melioribacteraceae bacterium]MCF8420639.1 ABC transporter permease [Melioribacteraceae bacterium]
MLKNYFKITVRNLFRRKAVSIINIFGLAAGLTFVILAGRYIYTETTFDAFHKNANSIFRVEKHNAENRISCFSPGIMRDWLKNNFPEIKSAARVINDGGFGRQRNLLYKNVKYNIDQPLIVDSDFFSIFSFKTKRGNIKSFKNDIHSIVLKESLAKKIFGDVEPVGKVVTYKNTIFTVKAIIEEPPSNSSIKFDVLLPYENKPGYVTDDWRNNTLQIFVQTADNISYTELENKLTTEINSAFKLLGYLQNNEASQNAYILNPLKKIYYSDTPHDNVCIHGNSKITLLLTSVAFIVLLIAAINFLNITYVKASERIKELGVRSASGASLLDNTRLLVFDSVVPCLLSVLLAIGFVHELEPFINPLLNTPLVELSGLQSLIIIVSVLILAFIAGIYPALKLASINTIESLKGKKRTAGRLSAFKGSLPVVQFTISIVLVISLFVIYKQINYVIHESNSNLSKGLVVYLPLANRTAEKSSKIFTIQNALKSLAEVKDVSTSLHIPGDESYSNLGVMFKNDDEGEREIMVNHNMVDADYPKAIGCEILEGRTFNNEINSDYGSYLINESFVKKYNLRNLEDATINGAPVIGVVKDFYYNSLRSKIEPLAIEYSNSYQSRIIVRLAAAKEMSLSDIVEQIRTTVDAVDNTAISDVCFLDEHIAALYDNEVRISKILFWLSLFSIIISCMGLFSMSMFMIETRTKEIGIRKVVGATVIDILIMITKDFTKWLIAANIIAYPVAYWAMSKWLESFAYKIEMSLWIFLFAGGIAFTVTILTVGFQVVKAATANPVNSLKYE